MDTPSHAAIRTYPVYIDGAWSDLPDRPAIASFNPATAEEWYRIPACSAEDVDRGDVGDLGDALTEGVGDLPELVAREGAEVPGGHGRRSYSRGRSRPSRMSRRERSPSMRGARTIATTMQTRP